jgi:hypothetical protein
MSNAGVLHRVGHVSADVDVTCIWKALEGSRIEKVFTKRTCTLGAFTTRIVFTTRTCVTCVFTTQICVCLLNDILLHDGETCLEGIFVDLNVREGLRYMHLEGSRRVENGYLLQKKVRHVRIYYTHVRHVSVYYTAFYYTGGKHASKASSLTWSSARVCVTCI